MLRPGVLKRARSEEQDEEDDVTESDSSDEQTDVTESDYSDEQTDAPVRRQRFNICEQCGEEYDVLHNKKKSCQWHEGKCTLYSLADI